MEEEETLKSAGSLKNPRPHITLRIPPATPGSTGSRPPTHYYTGPLTPTAVNISDGGVDVFTMYPGKAGQFVSKQFLSFRDFTLKSAKSGLSVGEKASFWMYGKIWALSRKWFTHFFLFAVVAAYSILGGFLFMEIEGNAEKEAYEDIVALRKNLVLHIKNLYEENQPSQVGSPGDLMWQGRSTQAIIEYENKLLEHFKQDSHILSKGDKPQWDFWSSVFYCGTIFTTIANFFTFFWTLHKNLYHRLNAKRSSDNMPSVIIFLRRSKLKTSGRSYSSSSSTISILRSSIYFNLPLSSCKTGRHLEGFIQAWDSLSLDSVLECPRGHGR